MLKDSPGAPPADAAGPKVGRDAQPLRPPLKWAGGKRWLVPRLKPVWAHYNASRLVEPFCGGLAIALGLQPGRALLGDINPHTINFYQQLQRGLKIRVAMRNERELYLAHREEFNRLIRAKRMLTGKAAGLFYYLNRTGFNGLCRFNRAGEFNVPFGQHTTINYVRDFARYRELLSTWQFECASFDALEFSPDDFVYADPPYDVPFTSYAAGGFSWAQQEALAARLATHQGPVIASNQATRRVLSLYKNAGFQCLTLPGPRSISRTGDRRPAKELLAYRNLGKRAATTLRRAVV
ncbi:MAG: Dam family site-specific DNA-(adenine-N6)-methyltransferase [Pseudomonadota bacterium]